MNQGCFVRWHNDIKLVHISIFSMCFYCVKNRNMCWNIHN
jgi:hypothetical protein